MRRWQQMTITLERGRVFAALSVVITVGLSQAACDKKTAGPAAPTAAGDAAVGSKVVPPPVPAAADAAAHENADAAAATLSPASSVAVGWIDALRKRDGAELVKRSGLPFKFRDTGSEVGCKSTTSSDPAALTAALKCLVEDELLQEDLKAAPQLQADVINRKRPPKWARRWMNDITPDMTAVSVFVPGNGDSFDFVFLVVGDRVQGLFKQVEFERN